jgi:hypothetical protein
MPRIAISASERMQAPLPAAIRKAIMAIVRSLG